MIFNAERDEFQCGVQRLVAGDCGVRRLVVAWLGCESMQAATSRRTPHGDFHLLSEVTGQ